MRRLSRFLEKHAPSAKDTEQAPPPQSYQPQQQGPYPPSTTQSTSNPTQHQPVQASIAADVPEPPGDGLTIALQNHTTSNTVFAYITGRAIDHNNEWYLLQSDARTAYYPSSPSSIMQPLAQNCAIPLGPAGNTIKVKIPHIAGGRIWFSIEQPLTFFLNPGPALVEPSVTNPSDPNSHIDWGFCEFTWNRDQLYANISYVDFVSLPISLHLDTVHSGSQHISGMDPSGLERIAQGLRDQHARDNVGWDQLIVNRKDSNQVLRVLSPNQGMVCNPNLFCNYFEPYVQEVYGKFTNIRAAIDTQCGFGNLPGSVKGKAFVCGSSQFHPPSTRDIFTCSTGPFATGGNPETNAIIPRLSAAFNRSTLLVSDQFPAHRDLYYKHGVTNHYSRIVHENNLDGKGYAFPYDDVQPSGGPDQSGEVHAGDPKLFTIAVGGRAASLDGSKKL